MEGYLLGALAPLGHRVKAELAQVSVARNETAVAVRLLESLIPSSNQDVADRVEAIQVATGRGQEAALARSARCESIAQLASDWYKGAQQCRLALADLYMGDDEPTFTSSSLRLVQWRAGMPARDDERAEQTLRFQKATASAEGLRDQIDCWRRLTFDQTGSNKRSIVLIPALKDWVRQIPVRCRYGLRRPDS